MHYGGEKCTCSGSRARVRRGGLCTSKTYLFYVHELQGWRKCVWLRHSLWISAPAAWIYGLVDWFGVENRGTCGVLSNIGRKCSLVQAQGEGAGYRMHHLLVIWMCACRSCFCYRASFGTTRCPAEEVMTWSTDGFYRGSSWCLSQEEGCALL